MINQSSDNDGLSYKPSNLPATPLPPHIASIHNLIVDTLNSTALETSKELDAIGDDVETELDEAEQSLVVELAGIAGEVDNQITTIEDDIGRKLDNVMTQAYRALSEVETSYLHNNIGVPINTLDMVADMYGDDPTWIMERLNGNSQPLTVISTPETTGGESHLCTDCAADNQNASTPIETETIPEAPSPITLPIPSPPFSPNGTTAPLPPPVAGPIDCKDVPALPSGVNHSYYMGPLGCMEVLEIPFSSEVSVTDLDKYWQNPGWMVQIGVNTWHGERPAQCVNGCSSPPSPPVVPPPPSPPISTTCPPVCPIPVDVHVDVDYKDPPLPPPPPPLPPPPDPGIPKALFDTLSWGDPNNACVLAGQVIGIYHTGSAIPDKSKEFKESYISAAYRGITGIVNGAVDYVFSGFDPAVAAESFKSHARRTGDILGGYVGVAGMFRDLPAAAFRDREAAWEIGQRIGSAIKSADASGFPVDYSLQSLTYLYQWSNPQYIPDVSSINAMYASQYIDEEQWACGIKANGFYPEWQRPLVGMMAPTLTPDEIVRLIMREGIAPAQLENEIKRARFRDSDRLALWQTLAKYVPGPSDLVRFMVRDVFDPDVVKDYNLDKDFELKFFGKLGTPEYGKAVAWAKAQGMDESQFKSYWRAHWDIPSNTALYEMLHRLRPDRPEYQQAITTHELWEVGGKIGAEPFVPPVVTRATVKRAIEVNDMSPTWVEPLLDISYNPITRTDAARAHEIGVFNDEQLYHAIRDTGSNDRDAKTLVTYYKQLRDRRIASNTGTWTIRKITKYYKDGGISEVEARNLLRPLLTDPNQINRVIQGADSEIKADTMLRWIKVYRRAYFTGELGVAATTQALLTLGVDQQRVNSLTEQWLSDKMGRYREATVRQLMEWAVNNLISVNDLEARLTTLGYSKIDADRIVYTAAYRQDKLVKAEIDKVIKDAEKRFKDKQMAEKATLKELQDRYKSLQKEQERIQKEMDKRKPSET